MLALASGCYGGAERLDVYVSTYEYGSYLGDNSLDGPDNRPLAVERTYAIDGAQGRVLTLKVGTVSGVLRFDFP